MAEFKFSCPQCGQHIQCDAGYAGMQINCPSCKQAIIVPQAPRSAAAPPAYMAPPPPVPPSAPPALGTRQSTTAPAAGRRFPGAPGAQPPAKPKSKVLKMTLTATAAVVGAAIGFFAVQFLLSGHSPIHFMGKKTPKPNPAAQVAVPTANAAIQALSILEKVHSAFTNTTSMTADATVTLFLDVSNLTVADVNPGRATDPKMASRHPPGMPRVVTNTTDLSVKQLRPNLYYFAGEAVSKVDRQTLTNTFAFWSSDKGQFMFTDSHQRGMPASYRQLADSHWTNSQPEKFNNLQHLFDDPAQLTKIIKDLGQTDDEPVNGQDCYTLTAKVLGQKVKIWVDKASYLIPQWQITLGGAISDADVDDVFSFVAAGFTNIPPATLEMIKAQVKTMTPTMAKIRGTIASTSRNLVVNPALTADDFSYPVPKGVRLVSMIAPQRTRRTAPASATSTPEVSQRNACINNLRQMDAAKNEWALEKNKKNGDSVTEADIKPYIKLDADGNLPKCPAGGTYTIGKVGEKPTCSISGHELP